MAQTKPLELSKTEGAKAYELSGIDMDSAWGRDPVEGTRYLVVTPDHNAAIVDVGVCGAEFNTCLASFGHGWRLKDSAPLDDYVRQLEETNHVEIDPHDVHENYERFRNYLSDRFDSNVPYILEQGADYADHPEAWERRLPLMTKPFKPLEPQASADEKVPPSTTGIDLAPQTEPQDTPKF